MFLDNATELVYVHYYHLMHGIFKAPDFQTTLMVSGPNLFLSLLGVPEGKSTWLKLILDDANRSRGFFTIEDNRRLNIHGAGRFPLTVQAGKYVLMDVQVAFQNSGWYRQAVDRRPDAGNRTA